MLLDLQKFKNYAEFFTNNKTIFNQPELKKKQNILTFSKFS